MKEFVLRRTMIQITQNLATKAFPLPTNGHFVRPSSENELRYYNKFAMYGWALVLILVVQTTKRKDVWAAWMDLNCMRLHDCATARLRDCATGNCATRTRDCVTAWLRDCVTAWLRDCVTAWLRDCVTARLRDCATAWLRDCVTARLRDANAWLRACDCVTAWCVVMCGDVGCIPSLLLNFQWSISPWFFLFGQFTWVTSSSQTHGDPCFLFVSFLFHLSLCFGWKIGYLYSSPLFPIQPAFFPFLYPALAGIIFLLFFISITFHLTRFTFISYFFFISSFSFHLGIQVGKNKISN
jgi:hypothetical protein